MFSSLKDDFPASIVVFLVAVPLCLGIALASGAPPFAGLISGIVGGILVGSLSGSSLSVSGPAAGLTLIVLNAIQDLGDYRVFLLAVVLAGIIQFVFGLLRAGIVGYYFPSAVIKGMLAAIGLILILKQIPHALGSDADYEGDISFLQPDNENTFTEIIIAVLNPSIGAVIISVVCLGALLFFEQKRIKQLRLFQLIPGALITVILGAAINQLFKVSAPSLYLSGDHVVDIPISTNFTEFLGQFTTPNFAAFGNKQVYITAITLALVASIETLLSVEATDKLDPMRRVTPTNRELKAQGLGNLMSGLIGGLPITAVIVRSSANVSAGGKTKLSAVLHGCFLLLAVIFIPKWMNLIPFSCLAAILFLVGYKLIKPSVVRAVYRKGKAQFIPFVVTVVAILVTDLLIGIAIGMVVGMAFVIKTNFHVAVSMTRLDNKVLIRMRKDVSFLNKALLVQKLESIPQGAEVIIDASKANFIDQDIIEAVEDFRQTAVHKEIEVTVEGLEKRMKH